MMPVDLIKGWKAIGSIAESGAVEYLDHESPANHSPQNPTA
jgi:hypothetical protein